MRKKVEIKKLKINLPIVTNIQAFESVTFWICALNYGNEQREN